MGEEVFEEKDIEFFEDFCEYKRDERDICQEDVK